MKKIQDLKDVIENNPMVQVVRRDGQELNLPVFLVGGFIRDFFLDYDSRDLDFVVEGNPEWLALRIARKLRMKPVRMDKGPITNIRLVKSGLTLDLTNMVGDSIRTDLARRDFTINSMAYSLIRDVFIDIFGGLEDLRRRLVRSVSLRAFCDDPLRTLRAFRLACTLDNFSLTENTWLEIKQYASLISGVSVERVKGELDLIITSAKAPGCHDDMIKAGLFGFIFKEFFPSSELEKKQPDLEIFHRVKAQLAEFDQTIEKSQFSKRKNPERIHRGFSENLRWIIPALQTDQSRISREREVKGLSDELKKKLFSIDTVEEKYLSYASVFDSLACFLLPKGRDSSPSGPTGDEIVLEKANSFMRRMRFSNLEIKKINHILMGKRILQKQFAFHFTDESNLKTIINSLGWDAKLSLLLFLAEISSRKETASLTEAKAFVAKILHLLISQGEVIIAPPVLLTGAEISGLTGIPPGVYIGKILKDINNLQIRGVISNRQEAVEYVQSTPIIKLYTTS